VIFLGAFWKMPQSYEKYSEKQGKFLIFKIMLTIVICKDYCGDGHPLPRRNILMRSLLITALVLSPALLTAKAMVPTQPQQSIKASAFVAKMIEANPVAEMAPLDTVPAPALRISTGIVPAKLLYTESVSLQSTTAWITAGKFRTAVVEMVVDKNGKPSELKVVKSAGADLDGSILQAVSHYRFAPATVSKQPTSMSVALQVDVMNPLR
jgi:TonB family protein